MLDIILNMAVVQLLADRPADVVGPSADQAGYRLLLTNAAIQMEAVYSLLPPCSAAVVRDVSTKVFNVTGQWKGYVPKVAFESVAVVGCGRKSVVNMEVTARLDGPGWVVQPRMPGDSHADYGLARTALSQIEDDLKGKAPKGCDSPFPGKNLEVGQTQIFMPVGHVFYATPQTMPRLPIPGVSGLVTIITRADPKDIDDLNAPLAWQELWPMKACGTDRSYLVTFAPMKSKPGQFDVSISPHWPGAYQVPTN